MGPQNLNELLARSLDDGNFSRQEKDLLKQLLAEAQPDENRLALYRHQAFETARAAVKDPEAARVLAWLEDVVKVLQHGAARAAGGGTYSEALFSPGDDCPGKIAQMVASARKSADICVFTITDNRIAGPILDAHRRGVAVRVLTDNVKMEELGSDIERFHDAGIPVRIDRTEYHMHHKFAIFDAAYLLTGSYNWTRGAAEYNQENIVVTNDPRLLGEFSRTFEKIWGQMQPLR